MIEITDHFLDLGSFMMMKDILLGVETEYKYRLSWSLNKVLSDQIYSGNENNENKHLDNNMQFCHALFKNNREENYTSDQISFIKPLIEKIVNKNNARCFRRIKANLNIRTSTIIKHGFHIDFDDNEHMTTAIYYVNSNDGYTEFEDGTKVESVENRLLTFPSSMKHCGTTCTNAFGRCVINMNYF